jgi:hypothetical protein
VHYPRDFGNGVRYVSPILTSPTWLDLAICANAAIHVTGNRHEWHFVGLKKADLENLAVETQRKLARKKIDAVYHLMMKA